mgnify:CR=1 FL=1
MEIRLYNSKSKKKEIFHPFDDEIVIAIGGASSGRAHARTGDRLSLIHI